MKIDLYNNHEQYIKEQRQDWNIGRWLKNHGVTVQDLDKHKQINDVVLLINIRNDLWHLMNSSEQAIWGAYWSIVYKKERALNKKALKKFETIAQASYQRHLKIKIISQIKSKTGTNPTQNIGHDNKAKGPCLPQVANMKREQQECRVVPERVWEEHELWW